MNGPARDALSGVSYGTRPDGGSGTTRLQVAINGTLYALRVVPATNHAEANIYYYLTKTDGEQYTVAVPWGDVPTCTCGDYHYRREQADPAGCKHVRALRSLRLLDLSWNGDSSRAVRVTPSTFPEPPVAPATGTQEEPKEPMPIRSLKIDAEAKAIISQARCKGEEMAFPTKLDRADYVMVDKILKEFGGKWSRAAGAHVFPGREASDVLAAIMAVDSVKKNPLSFFETPELVAYQLFTLADLDNPPEGVRLGAMRVLEPSAGGGAILRLIDDVVRVGAIVAVEVDDRQSARVEEWVDLASRNEIEVVRGDFMAQTAESLGGPFHKIVMNPPFVLEGEPNAYVYHVLHAYQMLAPGGRLAAVTPIGWINATRDPLLVQFRDFVETFGGHQLIMPEDAFQASGTSVRTTAVYFQA